MSQYFNLFQLEPSFNIDTEALEQTYRALAARFHPDKFASASAFEQKQAVMMSSTINDAYRTLKSPIDRAAYLLKSQNIDADAPEHTSFSPEFLMQQMEWRETLMDAQMEQNHDAIRALDQEIQEVQSNLYQDLQQAFEQQDYESAAQWVRHGRFLNKLRNEIASIL
ncbi:Fe-S protein assembly co-chaperone HscB [Neisseria subflava]|jgi:Fe-S protein assembly co-chaperone hscB|uniref:Fe-S protein assembly co-chaperone HscB n=2 Tax=Neisseriaceae TaxID=481 RepID=UPI00066A8E7E|nr:MULTISPECIES: Fe-S protein assembly co-chaperone HscB [Neisseria]KZC78642.1 Fe-S protein assembly co-chaperone HscB [Neisseria flavescens]KZC82332.1 Fe-S protein assembly co-chaperone HscB [Neisseria flavescens]MBF1301649.1 Fe-S protein assembly co-chaperone HscB [Neisseria sp.]MCL9787260.1 Fe-S protein assembly co-chaperone HscB [Neisseria subflava]OFO25750.1 Fe-S protein assembly co-chaperone HscB [Neisseria sp. HMSC056A03]